MIAFPNAKINIGLNIISRRGDGYHNLETVFYPIKINDALEIIELKKLTITTSGIEIPGNAGDNLCLKAYDLIRRDFDVPLLNIHIHKHIPIGAGLGGGSSDAAFFIRLVNDTFKLGMDLGKMDSYARLLGADCAFFLRNIPVFAYDKGDKFSDINAVDLSSYFIVLVMPPVHVSTGEAYRGVIPKIPDSSLKELITMPVSDWRTYIKNDFEETIFKNHPSIRGVKAALYDEGAVYASMSGSGSSVYGIFKNEISLPELEKENVIFYNV